MWHKLTRYKRILRVWELNTGMEQYRLTGHTSTIRCVKISVDDPRIAVSGSRDASLRIWDVEQGQVRHVCWGHQASVRCIDIHDQRVVSGSYDHTARLWDMNTGECIHTFIGHRFFVTMHGVRNSLVDPQTDEQYFFTVREEDLEYESILFIVPKEGARLSSRCTTPKKTAPGLLYFFLM